MYRQSKKNLLNSSTSSTCPHNIVNFGPLTDENGFLVWCTPANFFLMKLQKKNRMWANAQRHGRPAEYRWRPLFNAAKFDWRPLLQYRAVMLSRRGNPLKFAGVPQTTEPISAISGPKFAILWGYVEVLLFNKFFPIVDTRLSCEDSADKVIWWCTDGDFFCVIFASCYFQRATCSTFQTCILNSH